MSGQQIGSRGVQRSIPMVTSVILIVSTLMLSGLAGCGLSTAEPDVADDVRQPEGDGELPAPAEEAAAYTPLPGDDWEVSTPAEQGLDPDLVEELYEDAADLDTLYSLLVVKNGYLVAEGYFNEGSIDQKTLLQSASKSYYSALVGIALVQGCLSSADQKMLDFFPELADQITDPRKKQITIRHLLQMRSGYPWEESDAALWEVMFTGDFLPPIEHFPLASDPGTEFHYSSLSPHWLGVIVERACDTDLKAFAQEHLLSPLGVEVGDWHQALHDQYYPDMYFTARDAARFGQLYLDDGARNGKQILPTDWVRDSLQVYSENAWRIGVGRNFDDTGYGFLWWSVGAGDHRYNLAWGHGGQQIALLRELDIVIVMTADPFFGQHNDESWKHERANLNLVADFTASLPSE